MLGVDLTVRLLELARRRASRRRTCATSSSRRATPEALPFVADSFDLVYCLAALHHIGDPVRAVDEMTRVCRPGGRMVLSDLITPSADARDTFDRLHRRLDPSHGRAFLESELVGLLPEGHELTYGATASTRMPISIAYTEQSDTEAVEAALRAELAVDRARGSSRPQPRTARCWSRSGRRRSTRPGPSPDSTGCRRRPVRPGVRLPFTSV